MANLTRDAQIDEVAAILRNFDAKFDADDWFMAGATNPDRAYVAALSRQTDEKFAQLDADSAERAARLGVQVREVGALSRELFKMGILDRDVQVRAIHRRLERKIEDNQE